MAWLSRNVLGEDREYILEAEHTTIGRSPANTIVIDDLASSRKHCLIKREGPAWLLQDLGSSNGTMVNGQKVKEKILETGDVITVGQTEFKFLP